MNNVGKTTRVPQLREETKANRMKVDSKHQEIVNENNRKNTTQWVNISGYTLNVRPRFSLCVNKTPILRPMRKEKNHVPA